MDLNLPRWAKGEALNEKNLNRAVDVIRTHLPVFGGSGILAANLGSGGTSVSLSNVPVGQLLVQVGRVVAAGPEDEADFDDYRHWVLLEHNEITAENGESNDELDLQEVDPTADTEIARREKIICAYNPGGYDAEGNHSHDMQVDEQVVLVGLLVDTVTDEGAVGQVRWFIVNPDIGVPQYDKMVLQGGQRKRLWAFTKAHGMIVT